MQVGTPLKKWNYLLENEMLVVQASYRRCVPGTHMYQCTRWRHCERLHSASVKFF